MTLAGVLAVASVLPVAAQDLKAPKISGLVNVRYSWSDKEGDTHGFDVRRVRLAADGELGKTFGPIILLKPKSNILKSAFSSFDIIKTFSGFKSRCAIPYE